MVTEIMEINDSLSYELNRRVSSTPFKDQKQEKSDGYFGKVEMACTRSSKYADAFSIHELPKVSYQEMGWLFLNQQKCREACYACIL
ncbi:hypothetical protein T07_8734 [Trichinella nelsoni]|uniref:Uncharacterized protein n=1 Tax=Trichinella nelsoni TaxID=6336 RepID=A0A0V0RFQ5_9BILA|nr:hypothetical protein T07_8734 [Trichinella nelsoni]